MPGTVGLLVVGLAAMIAGGALRTSRPSRGPAGAPCRECHRQRPKTQELP
jgi:hypothetical protein